MGKFDALAEALGLAVKKYGDDAAKILEKVDNPEVVANLSGKAKTQYGKALKETNSIDAFLAKNPDVLYHSGPSKNIKKIQSYGLEPQHGPLVQSLDAFSENLQPAMFYGEKPSGFYGLGGKTPYSEMTLNKIKQKAASFTVPREEDIFRLIDQEGNKGSRSLLQKSTGGEPFKAGYEGIDVPAHVEPQDYFTFETKSPSRTFKSLENIELLTKKDPYFVQNLPKKQKTFLESIKNLPSEDFQKSLKEALAKDKNLAVMFGLPLGGAAMPQMDVGEQINPLKVAQPYVEAYEEKEKNTSESLGEKYEQFGEKLGAAYNKYADWADEQKLKQEKAFEEKHPEFKTRGESLGMTPEQYDS